MTKTRKLHANLLALLLASAGMFLLPHGAARATDHPEPALMGPPAPIDLAKGEKREDAQPATKTKPLPTETADLPAQAEEPKATDAKEETAPESPENATEKEEKADSAEPEQKEKPEEKPERRWWGRPY